ncbi:MAG: hypothetical protein AAF623_18135 [Planctomycetota bacterium]
MPLQRNLAVIFHFCCLVLLSSLTANAQSYPVQYPAVTDSLPQYQSKNSKYSNVSSPLTQQQSQNINDELNKLKQKIQLLENQQQNPMNSGSGQKLPSQRPSAGSQTRPRTYDSILKQANGSGASKKKSKTNSATGNPQTKKTSKKLPPHYGIDYSIYRQRNPIPIDPRVPCNQCTRPSSLPQHKWDIVGRNGRPYVESEIGGCQCEKNHPNKRPRYSVYWPRPMSAKLDHRFPGKASSRYSQCPPKRIIDFLNPLDNIKLSQYKRSDNGYAGVNSDPYGCLGESRYAELIGRTIPLSYLDETKPSDQLPVPAESSPGYFYPVDDPAIKINNSGFLK